MENDQDDDENVPKAFFVPEALRIGYPDSYWQRDTLFKGSRGEIGLAWSIFKIFGTPTKESWPVSDITFICYRIEAQFP